MKRNILSEIWIVPALLFGQTLGYTRQTDITMHRIVGSEWHAASVANYRGFKLHKYNRSTQIVKGDFEAFVDLDNSVSISFTIYKKAGNQWKITPFRIPETKFCDWARDDTIFMEDMIERSGLPPKGSCPAVPKGKYHLSDFPVSTVNIPEYFNGEFWVSEKMMRNGKVADEINYYGEITHFDRF